ncbi:MAG TPA: MmcQ/YjbR family DNA-binding protein [Chthonomonadaceae bacterium]|nr:MmcQ/YjbR family DNA-binding protein [Chthonomonadaceae bacterium]
MADFDTVRQIALALPGVEEGSSYGTPGFRVKGKLFLRLQENGEILVARVDPDERAMLLAASPDTLTLTDHYRPHPWILVVLPAVSTEELHERIIAAWALSAPPKLAAQYVASRLAASSPEPTT